MKTTHILQEFQNMLNLNLFIKQNEQSLNLNDETLYDDEKIFRIYDTFKIAEIPIGG